MKILAAADIHGNHSVYEWLVDTARDHRADLVVLAGDLLGCPDGYDSVEAAQRQDAMQIVDILQRSEAPVYYIMGNDDLVELDPRPGSLTSIHGRRVDLSGANLVGYQYSLPFMGGVFEKPEEEIRADLEGIADRVDAATILVTHNPAYGVLDVGILDRHAGSAAILELVRTRNVRAHIHGHIHGQFGREGRHFNVAAGGRHLAMVIDLTNQEVSIEKKEGS
jgi:Icc-related predicted phosphoesterase